MSARDAIEQNMSRLAEDVSFLGKVLGDVLREQGGEALFETVEGLRVACKARRQEMSAEAEREVDRRVDELSPGMALQVVRAFTMYFHLINMAEENHRLRRLREAEIEDHPKPNPDSIKGTIQALQAAGTPPEDVRKMLQSLSIRPVFTAHPTEARRRTLLHHLRRIAHLVEARDGARLPPNDRRRLTDKLYAEVTGLWQTNELRSRQQTVLDEVRTSLYYFDHSVFEVTARTYRDLHEALEDSYPELAAERFQFLSFGSWIGGDRDGNPNVTGEVTAKTLRMHKEVIVSRYIAKVQALLDLLASSTSLIPASAELELSLEQETESFGSKGHSIREQYPGELYRQKLGFILLRLRACLGNDEEPTTTRRQSHSEAGIEEVRDDDLRYPTAKQLEADLRLMLESLEQNRGARIAHEALQDLIWQVGVFGFHLARLDVRQHRDRHLQTLDELFTRTYGLNFSSLSEDRKVAMLEEAIRSGTRPSDFESLSEHAQETVRVFRVIARAQEELGREAVDTYIISFTQEVSDVLAVLYLASLADLFDPLEPSSRLRVVPLFETQQDLEEAPRLMRRLYSNSLYRLQLQAWNHEQEIMLGYSDSDKDAGYVSSNWLLYQAQQELQQGARKADVSLTFFHGRGGAIGRGGGPLHRAISGQPSGTIQGRIKVTEQGEVLFTRYANPGIAHRHLEQVTTAVIRASVSTSAPRTADIERWEDTFASLSKRASQAYRGLVSNDEGFLHFFEEGTPLRSIMRLRIASRPPTRRAGSLRLEDLRAIPWVFAWIQSRCGLPGWYGLGYALTGVIKEGRAKELQRMYQEWQPFRWLIDASQISLGKADLDIAGRYATLVPRDDVRERYAGILGEEFRRTVDAVNCVVQQDEMLDCWPILQRSIELRNPYVDPMSYIQVAAIKEVRGDADDETLALLRSVIDRSVTGIAAGLQNTG